MGYLGTQPVTPVATIFTRIFTALYFGFFLLMPVYTRWEKTKREPARVTEPESPTLKERKSELLKLFDESTVKKRVKTKEGKMVFKRRLNPSGMVQIGTRFLKNIKDSLD